MIGLRHLLVVLVLSACGPCADDDAENDEGVSRKLAPQFQAVAEQFGQLVVEKRYDAAYELMAQAYKTEAGRGEFMPSIARYRDLVTGQLTVTVEAGDDDPAELPKSPVVQLLIPEQHRARIVEEAVLGFEEAGEEGGSWALVMWLVEDADGPRVLQFMQED